VSTGCKKGSISRERVEKEGNFKKEVLVTSTTWSDIVSEHRPKVGWAQGKYEVYIFNFI
jgi:hypothetical protein